MDLGYPVFKPIYIKLEYAQYVYIYILKDMGIYGQLLNIALSLAIAAIYRFFVRDLSLLHLLGMQCANAGSWMLGGMKKTPET